MSTINFAKIIPAKTLKRIQYFECINSTNAKLKEMAQNGAPCGQVVVAGTQTAGKGRLERNFVSNDGGIYLSYLLQPDCTAEQATNLTPMTAVAVFNALQKSVGVSVKIKWVNDIILNDKKLGGILAELVTDSFGKVKGVIIGIGINVNTKIDVLPSDLQSVATSLYIEFGKEFCCASVIGALIDELDNLCDSWQKDKAKYLQAYKENCVTLNNEIKIISQDNETIATAVGIDDEFGLLVKLADGSEKCIRGGDVSVRGLCGYLK